jgi:hypothetical protein
MSLAGKGAEQLKSPGVFWFSVMIPILFNLHLTIGYEDLRRILAYICIHAKLELQKLG